MKYGSLFTRGNFVLFLDADGATHYTEIPKIYKLAYDEANKNEKR